MRTIPSAVPGGQGGVLSAPEHATDRVAAVASIQIKQEFTMPRKELRKEVARLAKAMQEQFQLDCNWRSRDCLEFQRSGAKGQIGSERQARLHHGSGGGEFRSNS